ncbi:MAG: hydroxymethylglutaryl-CoA lyase [Fimbriimonadaceae bacterium]|nr:hydroxymethylglutaryl-CoA lyase [Fimbriimonadaceae bacterium]
MVRIVEVGPRDGLQNESVPIPTETKRSFVEALLSAGLFEIEATSFVSPKWVPQLADASELLASLGSPEGARFSALVPNRTGLERALASGVGRIAVFTAASDAFTVKNIGMTVKASLATFAEVVAAFRAARPDGWVRGYVSTAFECPYAGRVEPAVVVGVCTRLLELGVDEISLGDTIGVAAPREVRALTAAVLGSVPTGMLAYHFHDTRGTAIANVAEALEHGVTAFDASAAGLGGCPYAPGAGGNLATEDLVYFLERSGVPTGVDPVALARASLPVLGVLGRSPGSKVQRAVLGA